MFKIGLVNQNVLEQLGEFLFPISRTILFKLDSS
jgi:hypothetical protein